MFTGKCITEYIGQGSYRQHDPLASVSRKRDAHWRKKTDQFTEPLGKLENQAEMPTMQERSIQVEAA